uniref:Uncharacterized protein n=1 Tax=Anguilla anguilla TaxID=7936 RepID=A0A0E9RWK5_ANGAN
MQQLIGCPHRRGQRQAPPLHSRSERVPRIAIGQSHS